MNNVIPRIVYCILLSLISTFAFAWARAFFWPGSTNTNPNFGSQILYHQRSANEIILYFTIERRFGLMEIVHGTISLPPGGFDSIVDPNRTATRADLAKWSYAYEYDANNSPNGGSVIHDVGYGWPVPALAERHLYLTTNRPMFPSSPVTAKHDYTIDVPQNFHKLGPGRSLPVRVILSGFIINVLTQTILLFALLWGISSTRRIVWHFKGMCSKCGYDLRHADHKVCPECGTPNH